MANRQESAGKLLLALPVVVGEQEEEEEEEESLPWSNVIVGGGGVFPTQNICQVNAQNAKGKFIIGRLPCDLWNLQFNPLDLLEFLLETLQSVC